MKRDSSPTFRPEPVRPVSVPAPSAIGRGDRVGAGIALPMLLVLALTGSVLPACTDGGEENGSRETGAVVGRGAEGTAGGVPLETPVPKPDFTLTDVSDGEPFHFAEETDGFVTLVFVGYTHCPDVCPVHMANLAAVLRELPRDVSERMRVVFISSDPERDTQERIRTWLDSFDPSFIGLRGSREEVRAVEEALGLPPSVVEEAGSEGEERGGAAGDAGADGTADGSEEDYFVGHAAQVLAFELDDTARVGFPWGTRQRDWRRALPRLVPDDEG